MIDRDVTGLAAATIALILAAGAWIADEWSAAESHAIDNAAVTRASLVALENYSAGQPLVWRDQSSGASAVITPASAWRSGAAWCRTYVVSLSDRPSTRHVACRDDAGRWTGLDRIDQQVAAN
jgi:surface antigen